MNNEKQIEKCDAILRLFSFNCDPTVQLTNVSTVLFCFSFHITWDFIDLHEIILWKKPNKKKTDGTFLLKFGLYFLFWKVVYFDAMTGENNVLINLFVLPLHLFIK